MRSRIAQWTAVGLWLSVLSLTTLVRCTVWTSDLRLWADALDKTPDKPRAILNDARAHELAGEDAYAEARYRAVFWLTLDDRRPLVVRRFALAAAETNLAHLAMKRGQMAQAMRILDGTLAWWPDFPYAHYNRGTILWLYGACADGAAEYAIALKGDPWLPPLREPCPSATP